MKKSFEEKFCIKSASSSNNSIRMHHDNGFVIGVMNGSQLVLKKESNTHKVNKLELFCFTAIYCFICIILWNLAYSPFKKCFMIICNKFIAKLYSIGILLTFFIIMLFVFFSLFIASEELKKNHSVEHMIVDFINQYKRLPHNLDELKEMPYRSIHCGTTGYVLAIISIIFVYFSLLLIFQFVQTITIKDSELTLIIEYLWTISFFLVFFIVAFVFEKFKLNKLLFFEFSKRLSVFMQKWTTSEDFSDKNLVIVYFIAEYWGKQFNKQILENANSQYWNRLANLYNLNIVIL